MSPHLILDIQVEIIKRLPVKSLIQFRSVCKAWKSLIDSSEFITGHNVCDDQPQHLMIRYEDGYIDRYGDHIEANYVSFVDDDNFPQQKFAPTVPPILQLLHQSRIIDSSCGLLCLDGFFLELDNSKTHMVVLWNPSIRKSIAVVVPNPFNSVVGFGVCPNTKYPKLVNITYIRTPCQVMVFTLRSREWRCLCSNQLPLKSIRIDDRSQTIIGQFIYWLAYDWIDHVDGDREPRNLIMSFDLSTDEFRVVDLPDSLAKVRAKSDFSVSRLRESLVVVEYTQYGSDPDLTWKQVCTTVWMMDHGDSKAFTKLFTIKVSDTPHLSVAWTLGFRKSGEPIVETQEDYLLSYAFCVVYQPFWKHRMELGIRGNRRSFTGSSYMESLLLLDHVDGHIVRCGTVKR